MPLADDESSVTDAEKVTPARQKPGTGTQRVREGGGV